jgi:hypothetical protein
VASSFASCFEEQVLEGTCLAGAQGEGVVVKPESGRVFDLRQSEFNAAKELVLGKHVDRILVHWPLERFSLYHF